MRYYLSNKVDMEIRTEGVFIIFCSIFYFNFSRIIFHTSLNKNNDVTVIFPDAHWVNSDLNSVE